MDVGLGFLDLEPLEDQKKQLACVTVAVHLGLALVQLTAKHINILGQDVHWACSRRHRRESQP